MPYLDPKNPALYLGTRLNGTRPRTRLGQGVAFTAPHVFTPPPRTAATVATRPTTTISPGQPLPVQCGAFPLRPCGPAMTFPVPTPKAATTPPPVQPPPQGGGPSGQIPNGPSNLPPWLQSGGGMTDQGGGPAIVPSNAGQFTAPAGGPVSGPDTSGGGDGGGGLSFFAALPWYVWVALGLGGFYIARKVMA